MFCTFIFAVLLVKTFSYSWSVPEIFYNHDLDRLVSRDIQMATRVGCGGIRLASFNSASPKASH